MTATPSNPVPASGRAHTGRRRRGTVLLFALGVLAVISVAALSYVTFVRVDRSSSSAAAKTVGYDRQVKRHTSEIGDALVADLFGNKRVTADVPKDIQSGQPTEKQLWPRMFEDGEYRDYPFYDLASFSRDLPGVESTGNNIAWNLRVGARNSPVQVAVPDDAWLAPIDPIWDTINGAQSHWRQISNLRSIWDYNTSGTPNKFDDDRWVRGDGKFVDLGQVLTDFRLVGSTRRGNPGTNLLDESLGAILPGDAAGDFSKAPYMPMNFMNGDANPVFTPSDERFWADTDGDLRPDARWQLIDSLGNAEGLLWVAATRIVDLSGMININSAIEGGYPSGNVEDYVAGRTPADIDLYRFLLNDIQGENLIPTARRWNWVGSAYPQPSTNRLRGVSMPQGGTFSDHIIQRLRMIDLTQPGVLSDPDPSTVNNFPLATNWVWKEMIFGGRLNADQRFEFWRTVGSAPGRGPTLDSPAGPVRPGYTNDVMLDLHAFSGSNNRSIVSEFEEIIDGPDSPVTPGYLPRPEDQAGDPIGPLASRVRPGDERYFSNAPNTQPSPATLAVRNDIRRLMTTVSGASNVSPVPVLNFDAVDYAGDRPYVSQYANTKISLANFSLKDVPAAYEAFVWALAPLATDKPLVGYHHQNPSVGATALSGVVDVSAHYGGPDGGLFSCPTNNITLTGGGASVGYGPTSGASFATITSAALAVNLKDTTDGDSDPTVARVLVSTPTGSPTEEILRSRIVDSKAYLGHRFSHGDIPADSLPFTSMGNTVTNVNQFEQAAEKGPRTELDAWLTTQDAVTGVTIVGAERQPYIGEVFAVAAYETGSREIILDQKPYQGGAAIAVQMVNPWPVDLPLDAYELLFMSPKLQGASRVLSSIDNLRFGFPAGSYVPRAIPGQVTRTTFLFMAHDPTKPDYRNVIGRPEGDTGTLPATSIEGILRNSTASIGPVWDDPLVPVNDDTRKIIEDFPAFVTQMRNIGANEKFTAVLRRSATGLVDPSTRQPALAVVDVLESTNRFFGYPTSIDLADPAFAFDRQYFFDLGYNALLNPTSPESVAYDNREFAGRVMLTSSITRPIRTSAGTGTGWFSYAAIQPFGADAIARDITTFVDYYAHAWLAPIPGPPLPLPAIDLVEPINVPASRRDPSMSLISDSELDQSIRKSSDDNYMDRTAASGGWQLAIFDRPLKYLSELHMVSTFAHTCKNNEVDNLEAWATVGSQLRWSMSNQYTNAVQDCDNPYLGVLDPSRFMPDGVAIPDGGFPREDSLAVPLAVRVFDCFEAINHVDGLAQGRVNLNTAPERVLQMLPSMAPANSMYLTQTNDRVDYLLRYRDAWSPGSGSLPDDVVDYTQYKSDFLVGIGNTMTIDSAKLRRHDLSHDPSLTGDNAHHLYTTGLSTVGELTFLDLWNFGGQIIGSTPAGFLKEVGADGDDAGATPGRRELLEGDISIEPDNIVDDPEERLALFRAVSNIVTSRSDVFGAWFVLRGYDPAVIEAIEVDDPTDPNATMDKAENNFLPTYESRWFVIFDRSNCRTPTDRPRVLLKAQLPSSRP